MGSWKIDGICAGYEATQAFKQKYSPPDAVELTVGSSCLTAGRSAVDPVNDAGSGCCNAQPMKKLVIGLDDKTEALQCDEPFLLIDDGPLADAFLDIYPTAHVFNSRRDGFNPFPMAYREARDFVNVIYGDKDLMTYRDGKRALMKMILHKEANRLDRLPKVKHKGYDEAKETVDDLLLSPTLSRILCGRKSFSFKGTIIAKINRAELGDDDARIIGLLLIQQFKGQIILPDFGFYARPFHVALIRDNRLLAGVYTLSELGEIKDKFRQLCELHMTKVGRGCSFEDAQVLADSMSRFPRGTNEHTEFMKEVMQAS